ncbi:MAG: ImmA/IrrE family metallo-endopeptidase [Peptostreptococcales bacterium]
MLNQLDNKTIDEIKAKARKKLNEYSKLNDVIGGQIFNILELENKVLYYPIQDDEVWGFSEKIEGKSFVWINTAIEYDKQVFAAADELYHLWFENNGEVILKADVEEKNNSNTISDSELKANRFAAEFLINEELLLQEMRTYSVDRSKIDIKDIIKLSNLFTVPYKTMVKRLYEIKLMNQKRYSELIALSNEEVKVWRNRLGLSLPTRDKKIGLSDLVDKAMRLYEEKKITKEKLEYLLGFSGLDLEEMGIEDEKPYAPPTDEELDLIMEEEGYETKKNNY